MTPVDNTQTIETVGQVKSIGKVTVTAKTIPFLINAVTDRIYKDKQLAIIREYSTNMVDSHVLAKVPISEGHVYLPTLNDPVFRIRDFGAGLTMEEVRDVYCILGESTKRGSNLFNGMLGIGSKAGYAYGDSFMVTSWVDGEKTIYNIIKGDDHKEGDVLEMARVPMAEGERTGIEVAIPIKIDDLHTIHSKAADFYKYWAILPTITNMDETELSRMMKFRNEVAFLSGNGWEIRPSSNSYGDGGKSVAVMGQVAYPIDWDMLSSKLAITPQKRIFLEILRSNDVVLQFPIGALKFTINREELEYTETTYKNLENKIEEIFKTLEDSVKAKFATAKSIWEAKRIYLALFGKNLLDKYDSSDDKDEESVPALDNAIKVLDGDFYRLEDMFKGKLVWNNVVIDEPHFSKMNQWDCDQPDADFKDVVMPFAPCLVSYRKKKSRIKRLTCDERNHNRITPYNGVKVIILDGRYANQTAAVARYFLLQPDKNVQKVHILRFANDVQKAKFFAHYHFDTAEYINISTIIDEVKAWQAANRKTYGYGGGGGTTSMKYVDVETGTIRENEVCLRDLEDGGVYVKICRKFAFPGGRGSGSIRFDQFPEYVKTIAEYCGGDLDRVYCIPEGKTEMKWFQKAKEEGLWIEISDYIKENVEMVVTDEMKRSYHFANFMINNQNFCLNEDWLNALIERVGDSSPELKAYADEMVEDPENYSKLIRTCNAFGISTPSFGQSSVDFEQLLRDITNKYPLIKWMNIGRYDSVNKSKLEAMVGYINVIDSQQKMLTSVPESV